MENSTHFWVLDRFLELINKNVFYHPRAVKIYEISQFLVIQDVFPLHSTIALAVDSR